MADRFRIVHLRRAVLATFVLAMNPVDPAPRTPVQVKTCHDSPFIFTPGGAASPAAAGLCGGADGAWRRAAAPCAKQGMQGI